jgi:outer membrane protein
MGWMRHVKAFAALCLALGFTAAGAQEAVKIGFVNTERILRDAVPAKSAQQKLEQEFSKREKELQEMSTRMRALGERLDRDAAVMSESDRQRRQREFAEVEKDYQRKQREFREDLNQRRNEELSQVIDKANRVIKQIAEQEKYDMILQEAVFASPRVDITEKVLRALSNGKQ